MTEAHNAFQRLQEAANWLNDIINDFLALDNLHKQKGHGQAAAFDLRQVTAQAIDQHHFAAAKKGITLAFNPPSSSVQACGNNASTHQIVSNYLSNAIKYSPCQSIVNISMELRTDAWRVEIKDQGSGVPADERHQLFKQFAKISSITTGGETSTRLGLAIVKTLAEAQGGKVGANFPDSGGSEFWVEIPLASA